VLSILKNGKIVSEIKEFYINKDIKILEKITNEVLEMIKNYDKDLLEIKPIPAEIIIKSSGEDYDIKDYIADIIQFLSCKEVMEVLK
jgi:hypothetical protein